MIKVLFFARIRDQVGTGQVEVQLPSSVHTLLQFTAHLIATHPSFGGIIDQPSVLVAINQEFANADNRIQDGDEIAYFPPVTGG